MIDFTEKELHYLRNILKIEIDDVKELINTEDKKTKQELEDYLKIIESIQQKIEKG